MGTLSETDVLRASVCLSYTRFRAMVTRKHHDGSRTMDERGYRSGRNVLDAEKLTTSISRKPSEIEPWLLLSVNIASRRLPIICRVSSNHRKGPKWLSAGSNHFSAIVVTPLNCYFNSP